MPIQLPARFKYTGQSNTGGFATVYVCDDLSLHRQVAIKVANHSKDDAIVRDEFQWVADVNSRHVVRMYDIIALPGSNRPALVEEYLPGPDLLTPSVYGDLKDYLRILFQIANGIADIHRVNRIHRDIKPGNIRFDQSNIIKIFDFGISTKANPQVTRVGRGTSYYRAPEYYNLPVLITEKADVYAFGVTAWRIGGNHAPAELMTVPRAKAVAVPSLATHPIKPPGSVAAIIDRALSLDPNDRPSMVEIVECIREELLANRRQGLLVVEGQPHVITKDGTGAVVTVPRFGDVHLHYDGYRFFITQCPADTFVNGDLVSQTPYTLPMSCVVIAGGRNLGAKRRFMTFDVSHPELL